jgi:L-threonylcarbamoyladenylate synthase
MNNFTKTGTDIAYAAELLRNGEVVGIPTETVYGLAGNALLEESVLTIFEVKKRPHFDPLIIHVSSLEDMEKYVVSVPDSLSKLAKRFMPGPLTLLLEKRNIIPDLVTAGSPLVAVRIPSHPLTLALLEMLDFPLAAPSANPFGYISPTTAAHVADQLGNQIPYILDGGPCQVGLESTIVGLENGRLTIFRKGGLELEAIREFSGREIDVRDHSSSQPEAPGMLTMHYAPVTPFVLLDKKEEWDTLQDNPGHCYLRFSTALKHIPMERQRILSPAGHLHEAARNLFRSMRELDEVGCKAIYAEKIPETGLGRAINDRLKRASAKEHP